MKAVIHPKKISRAEIMQSMIASFRIENIEISQEYAAASLAKAEEKLKKLRK